MHGETTSDGASGPRSGRDRGRGVPPRCRTAVQGQREFCGKAGGAGEAEGSAAPARQGRPPGGGKLAPYLGMLIGWVEAEPDITMPELAAKLRAETGVAAHPASLSRLLRQAGFSVKKNASGLRDRARRRA